MKNLVFQPSPRLSLSVPRQVVARKLTVSQLVIRKHPPPPPPPHNLVGKIKETIKKFYIEVNRDIELSSSQIYFYHFVSSKLIPFL